MSNLIEWEEFTIKKSIKYGVNKPAIDIEYRAIKRLSDNFTLIRTGLGREFQEYFQCTGNFEDFEFTASNGMTSKANLQIPILFL